MILARMAVRSPTARDATPIGRRSASWFYHCYGIWTDADDTRHISWVKDTAQALRPWTTAGMALNFFTDIDDRVRSAFGEEKYRRLVALQDRYDPDNVFHRNQNVRPSMAASDLVEPMRLRMITASHSWPLPGRIEVSGRPLQDQVMLCNSLISVDDHRVTATATSG